jgi:geranylgeranyl transferase type-2 subunit alpha
MHNQNRTQYKARQSDPIVADALSKKASSWNTLTRQLLLSRQDGTAKVKVQEKHLAGSTTTTSTTTTSQLRRCDEETCLKVSYKLLLVNPDPSYLWNARRELITFTQLSTELELTKAALQRKPKAYAAWYHRKWCVRYFALQTHNDNTDSSTSTSTTCSAQLVLEQELHLCSELLNADERNFHCWNYRRFVVGAMASQFHLSSSSSLVRTPVGEDKGTTVTDSGNAAEASQPPPIQHTTINYCSALDGSWDTFVNALLITSTDTIDHYHYSLCRIGPQLTWNDSVPPAVGCSENKNTTTSLNNLPSGVTHEDQRNQFLELLRGEWLFTTHKIEQNFSNYSAYHYRSKLLPLWISVFLSSSSNSENNNNNSVSTIQQFLLSEFQVVRNAIYTEPDDQSSWWYHRYLLDYCKNVATTPSDEDRQNFIYVDVLLLERETIQELLRAEDGHCKWGWITLHAILLRLIEITLMKGKTNTTTVCLVNYDSSISNLQLLREEAEECLLKLIKLDPDRQLRYQDMLQDLHQTKELDM